MGKGGVEAIFRLMGFLLVCIGMSILLLTAYWIPLLRTYHA
ncbi:hypothetical protein ACNKHQ_09115 [Shigella flexneri]